MASASDTANEDWLRTAGWDLPAELGPLLQVLTGKPDPSPAEGRAALRRLQALPAWEAVPDALAVAAALYLGPSGPGGTLPAVEGLDEETLRRIERILAMTLPVDGERPLGVNRAGFDPRQHPRVLHGEHGGEFARKPTVGAVTGEKFPGQFADRLKTLWAKSSKANEQGVFGTEATARVQGALNVADAAYSAGDYEEAVAKLREAAKEAFGSGYASEISDLADAIESGALQDRAVHKAVLDFTTKGADAVPDLLGGGQEIWDRTVEIKPELGMTAWGPAAADMGWTGKMRMTTDTADHIAGDLKGNGELRDLRYFSIPLHELIHGVHGGKREEAEQARLRSGRTQRDDQILDAFHRLDLANATGGATPTAHHLDDIQQALGREKLTQSMKMEGEGVTQADIDSLVDRGFLEWTGTSSSTYEPGGKIVEHGRSWLRTPKAVNTDPRGPEPYDIHTRAYTEGSGVQAIEEGFTELGTIQHASEYFTKTGIGRRDTPYIAPSPGWRGKEPGPALKRQVTGKLKELVAQSGDGKVARALAAWREGDRGEAITSLSFARNRALTERGGWVAEADQILDLMGQHPPTSPQWERKRAALQQRLSLEATKIQTRVIDAQTGLGQGGRAPDVGGYVQQIHDLSQLQRLSQAMNRAANDLEYGDTDSVLEELGHLQHSGDTKLADDAVSLGDDLQALIETPSVKRETLAAYSRRLASNRDAIINGNVYGAYAEWTKQALLWCEAVAKAEGLKPGSAAFKRRVRELADEVNREGPGRKIDTMVDQVLRLPHTDRWGRPGMVAHVRDTYRGDGAESAFQGAHVRAVPTSDPEHDKLMKKYRGW